MNKEAMNQYIDEKITGEERAIMQEVLLELDPEDRKNVVFIDKNGRIYATSEELKSSVEHYSLNDQGLYESKTGEIILPPVAAQDVMPLAETGKGPYRRVSSVNGKSWMSIYAYLPGGSNIYVPNGGTELQKDTPYVYIGGTGGGTEVDAGMLFNGGKKNWSLFLAANGSTNTYTPRMKAAQKVFLKYYVSATNKVTVSVTGVRDDNNTKDTFTLSRENVKGWNTAGTNCVLKHVVSIAQGNNQNFKSGAYIKGVVWSDGRIGTSSTNNAAWTAYGEKPITYPETGCVTVDYINAGNETDTINLT